MLWTVYYKHTFGVDIFKGFTKKRIKEKAIQSIKNYYNGELEFPNVVVNGFQKETIYCWEDLIEEIIWTNPIIHWYEIWCDSAYYRQRQIEKRIENLKKFIFRG